MENPGAVAVWGLIVGASLLSGAVAAAALRLPERVAATITAFGHVLGVHPLEDPPASG